MPNYGLGGATILLGAHFLLRSLADIPTCFALVFLILICATDTLRARIPNLLTFSCILVGLVFHLWQGRFGGFAFAFSGFSAGLGLFLVPFLLGGMGAGDVKALAALGTLVGPADIFNVFLFTGLFGGVLAILHYALAGNLYRKLIGWRDALVLFFSTRKFSHLLPSSSAEKLRFPYAAAIALGFFAHLSWGGLIEKILPAL